jgi:hypothetical protein
MADEQAAILARAKALAAEDGFTWEYGVPAAPRAKLRHQRFLSRDRQQDYLERAKLAQRAVKIGHKDP